jgi:S1-C subfamily serine protease
MTRMRAIVAICCLWGLDEGLWAAEHVAAPRPDVPALCQRVRPAFVFIDGGSGVIVSPNGWMLTNSHVVGQRGQFDVRTGSGRHYRAKVLGRDVSGDLAVLQLEIKPKETVPYLEIGDSDALHIGDYALAVGNPFAEGLFDQNPTFTLGVISALHQTLDADAEAIVTDAAVNPGNSGGPLIDMAGRVVGINGQIATRWGLRSNTGLGYAISARQIRLWLPRLAQAKGGNLLHGRLSGVEFESNDDSDLKVPKIADIVHDSSAAKAGLKIGDRITRFDGRPIRTEVELAQAMHIYPQDQEVGVNVQRDGKDVELKLRLLALKPGELGIKLAPPGKSDNYVHIAEFGKDSSAQQAGLKKGDEIVKVDRIELKMAVQMQFQMLTRWLNQGLSSGDIARIEVRRKGPDGKIQTKEIRVVAR